MNDALITLLLKEVDLSREYSINIVKLLEEGNTIPFIARYRKEHTGGLDDVALRAFEAHYMAMKRLLKRKEEIVEALKERGLLSQSLKRAIDKTTQMSHLEDLYLPYKKAKETKASKARKAGLLPLAKELLLAEISPKALEKEAQKYTCASFPQREDVIQGMKDILAEKFSQLPKERALLRRLLQREGVIEVKAKRGCDEKSLYWHYRDHQEAVRLVPSHRYLAMKRGEKEGFLRMKILLESSSYFRGVQKRYFHPKMHPQTAQLLLEAYEEGFKRLLFPSMERETFAWLKERADEGAIDVFGKNMRQLFLTPPLVGKMILGVDPAYKSGCKVALLDKEGGFLASDVIYPTPPRSDYEGSKRRILSLMKQYGIDVVAIGNGTGSYETQCFFARLNEEGYKLPYTVVSEAGASVYSASKIASQEYPQLDVTIRGAISIGGRLRDPLATLVKIDPKALGIGQYQHDVDQKRLAQRLHDEVESMVNSVGVDVNSASRSLLAYIAGISEKLAEAIVKHREEYGRFPSKASLLKVKGFGKRAYEQSAGFLRIRGAKNPFDETSIHPESYVLASQLQRLTQTESSVEVLAERLGVGVFTIKDTLFALEKPHFDPRHSLEPIPFKEGLSSLDTLEVGSVVSGVVRNIVDFGVFVDIGLKNDGLIHISALSHKRIKHPLEVVSVNEYLSRIWVDSIDREKGRVGLSLKELK